VFLRNVARPVAAVSPDTPVADVDWERAQVWVVQPAGRPPEALVHPATLAKVPPEDRGRAPASSVAFRMPQDWAVSLGPDALFEQALEAMRATGAGVICLLDEEGRPWGAVAATDLDRPGRATSRS
jgi:hypothetical protein